MRVLAVDTTTERGSLAVVSDEGVLAEARVRTGAGHSRWLLPAVEALLHGLGLVAPEIDAFAVTTGPGSFTGLRIGLSSVQGLALASERPCVGLSALGHARPGGRGGGREDRHPDGCLPRRGVLGRLRPGRHPPRGSESGPAGGGARRGAGGDRFRRRRRREGAPRIEDGVGGALFPEVELHLAAALGRAALARLAVGDTIVASELRPLYLRGADVGVSRP